MLQFQFERPMNFRKEIGKLNPKMVLNEEWSILCHSISSASWGYTKIEPIEIQRRSTAGEHSVSGKFQIMLDNRSLLWEQNFSGIISTGSQGFKVCPERVTLPFCTFYWFQGVVKISDNLEKCFQVLKNEKSEKVNHLEDLEELSNHLERLLGPDAACFADVTLKSGGVSIPAHKVILSTRSPVFAAMFSSQMKECQKNEVNITDVDISTLRALLTYVYTGKTSDLSCIFAEDLLFAADKYQIAGLKRVCSDALKKTASLQNVLRILVLGEMHSEELKSFAVEFICKNCAEFSVLEKSEEWKALQNERPHLAIEVLSSLVTYREKH